MVSEQLWPGIIMLTSVILSSLLPHDECMRMLTSISFLTTGSFGDQALGNTLNREYGDDV